MILKSRIKSQNHESQITNALVPGPKSGALQMTPFSSASVPNMAMVFWAAAFTAVTLIAALRSFEDRTL